MKKISSKNTPLLKKGVPVIWLGFLILFATIAWLRGGITSPRSMPSIALLIFMAIFGYTMLKKSIFILVDEAYDEVDTLRFRNNGKEIRVPLKDIKNVNYQTMARPQRVTMSLRYDTPLGKNISFTPQMSIVPFKCNKDIEELIDRIDRTRS